MWIAKARIYYFVPIYRYTILIFYQEIKYKYYSIINITYCSVGLFLLNTEFIAKILLHTKSSKPNISETFCILTRYGLFWNQLKKTKVQQIKLVESLSELENERTD